MPIDVKGLGASVEAARAAIRKARTATGRMVSSGATLEKTANEIATTFEKHTEDLLFEAQTLGNSNGGETETETKPVVQKSPEVEPPKTEQTFQQPGEGNVAAKASTD